jgi:hypothetical protein
MTPRACGSTGSGGGDRAALVRNEGQEDEDGTVGSGSTHARVRPAWCGTGGTSTRRGGRAGGRRGNANGNREDTSR